MARKLAFGWSMTFCTCVALVGCQTGLGSRFAKNSNNDTRHHPSAVAKQNNLPPPSFPTANANNNAGFRTTPPLNQNVGAATPTNAAFPQTTTNVLPVGASPTAPGVPAAGPQPFGTPNTTNRFTQPDVSVVPPPPPQPLQQPLAPPGISPIQ